VPKAAPAPKPEAVAQSPASVALPKTESKIAAAGAGAPAAGAPAADASRPAAPATAAPAAQEPRAAQAPRKTAPKPAPKPARIEVAAAKPEAAALAVAAAPEPAAGVLQLSILPWGEVFVDGKSRGVSPPLRSIELPPGAHAIEVRNTTFPAHTQRVEVRSGEPVRIRHQFR
jgi:hypothetical protein